MEEHKMLTQENVAIRNRMLLTVLVTLGWLVLMPGWMIFAWGRYSFFQGLIGLGIATLVFAAVAGALWVADQGFRLTATILTTLGGLSFVLYWIGFAWGRHSLLLNGAILGLSFLGWLVAVVVLWLAGPADQAC
jgi:hypothetical protein